jgi:hypothetical protein
LHSRPIEGAITSLITFAALAWYARFKDVISRFLPGFVIALVPAFALLALHDYRVTGDALLHPHVLHQRKYMVGTPFFWERPNFEQRFNSSAMRNYAWDHDYEEQRQQFGFANHVYFFFFKGGSLLMQYVEPITLLIALAAVPWRRVRAARIAAAVCIAVPLIQLLISPWMRPAYMAPVFAPLVLLFVLGIRRLNNMNRWGRMTAQMIVITAVATYFLYLEPRKVTAHQPAAVGRQQIIEDLRKRGGRHLVIVRYGRDQVPVFDLVANGADFAEEPVIFAREIAPNDNRKLSESFPDRTAWLLEVQPEIRMTPLRELAN